MEFFKDILWKVNESNQNKIFQIELDPKFTINCLERKINLETKKQINELILREIPSIKNSYPIEFYKNTYLVKRIDLGEEKFLCINQNGENAIDKDKKILYLPNTNLNYWDKQNVKEIFGTLSFEFYKNISTKTI